MDDHPHQLLLPTASTILQVCRPESLSPRTGLWLSHCRLCRLLQSVREEIQAAATAPISRFSQQLPTIHEDSKSPLELSNQTSEKTPNTPDPGKLNVALTVNINAGDRKGWKLLSRVQSVISRFSTLDIHGPRDLVREFVQDMERVEAVHKQVVANAARWENIATEELHQVDAL